MSFVPSVRECLHQLDRVRDTPQIVADLNALHAELAFEEPATEMIEAAARLTVLHQLCLHLAANLSGGAGIPPTPVIKATSAPAVAATSMAPVQPITSWAKTPTPKAARAQADASVPANRRTITQLIAELDRSQGWIYRSMLDAGFPRPVGRLGLKCLWDADAVQAWLASQPLRVDKLKATIVSDPDTYTTAEAAERIGISPSTLLSLRSRGHYGLDAAPAVRGTSILWNRALIDGVADEYQANPPRLGRPAKGVQA
jgi:predicted DNA-binding transcriptional regulator AlpA